MTTRRTTRPVVLLVAFAVAVVIAGAVGCAGDVSSPASTSAASGGARVAPTIDIEAAAADLLDRRQAAVESGDLAAWETTVATGDPDLLARERQTFAGTQALPLEEWEPSVLHARAASEGGARVSVEIEYRLDGDDRTSRVETLLDLVPGEGGLVVAGSSSTPVPLWEVPGIAAVRGERSWAVGDVRADTLADYAEQVDAAAVAVADLAPDGSPPPLSLVAVESWERTRLLVGGGAAVGGMAALATHLEPPGVEPGAARVLVDVAVLDGLDRATREAVIAHEALHVAMQDLGSVPLWLSEGLADHAGYRESGVPLDRAISGFLTSARDRGVPETLPADADFTPGPGATAAYEGAHLAVRMLIDRHGEEAVLRVYERVAAGGSDSLDQILRSGLGRGIADITAAWRSEAERRAAS